MKAGWEVKPLGEVCDYSRGLTYKKSDEVEVSSNRVLRANNVDRVTSCLDLADIKYIRDDFKVPVEKKTSRDAILICTASGSKSHLGKVALVDTDEDYAFGGFMGLIMPKSDLLPKFLHFSMLSKSYTDFIEQCTDGANINNLKFSQLSTFPIPIPPLAEQKQIVAVLDAAFEGLTRAKENAEANLQNARELFESLAKQHFMEIDGEFVSLGECCEIYQPKTISKKEMREDGEFIVFGANGPIGRYHTYNHKEPQLLVTCRGATCGFINTSEPFSWITGNAMVVMPKQAGLERKYLEAIFKGFVDFSQVITGAAQPQITRASLSPLKIPVPDLQTQHTIINALSAARLCIDDLEAQYTTKLTDIADLRQSLLQKAFAGDLT